MFLTCLLTVLLVSNSLQILGSKKSSFENVSQMNEGNVSLLKDAHESPECFWCTTRVYVKEDGVNNVTCYSNGDSTTPCKTLSYALKKTKDNTTIHLLSNISLDENIEIYKKRNIAIYGKGWNETYIKCAWGSDKFNVSSIGAGLSLYYIRNFTLSQLTMQYCGTLQLKDGRVYKKLPFRSSVHMWYCRDVTIDRINITSSNGIGLALFNAKKVVKVIGSTFAYNHVWKDYNHFVTNDIEFTLHGGGGVHVTVSHVSHSYSIGSKFIFKNCVFYGNRKYRVTTNNPFPGIETGGGLQLRFDINATSINTTITHCRFSHNHAKWGGGMFIGILENASNNSVIVLNSVIEYNNVSHHHGGGGIDTGFYKFDFTHPPMNNHIAFHNCRIQYNNASYGGGNTIYSDLDPHHLRLSNYLYFKNCTWLGNRAEFSAATDVSPNAFDKFAGGFSLTPRFRNCKFLDNIISPDDTDRSFVYSFSSGVFSTTAINVEFNSETQFINNTGTALKVNSAIARFWLRSHVIFQNNRGSKGGGLALVGISHFQFEDNSIFIFENNTAELFGGAIYFYSIDQHDYISSSTCFLKYFTKTKQHSGHVAERNVTFYLINNRALSNIGQSIYASTLSPCTSSCYCNRTDYLSFFNCCIANFIVQDSSNGDPSWSLFQVDTTSYQYHNQPQTIQAVPGELININPIVFDECQNNVTNISIFWVTSHKESNVSVEKRFQYTTTGEVKILGEPGNKGKIQVKTTDTRSVVIEYNISLQNCPPGFVVINKECICKQDNYPGITCKIQDGKMLSYILLGSWVGYVNNVLMTSTCHFGYCDYKERSENKSSELSKYNILPTNTSKEAIDEFICKEGRTGILCGDCLPDHSVFYHSTHYRCYENNNRCDYWFLFYILSELLPITIVFIFVLIFNISFTSGAVNGFILFAQVIDLMYLDANGYVPFNSGKYLINIHEILYGLFNMELDTSSEALSFCLWRKATTLDVLVMKYVTTGYALILVLCLVFIMNHCNCYCICTCKCFRKRSFSTSIIHGLSAFLVMCYSQCTRVTFSILRPGRLLMEGSYKYERTVADFNGNLEFFGSTHQFYAIPALFFLLTFVMLPPLILLFNASIVCILPYLNKRGCCTSSWLTNKLLMTRLKPLLDSFQGCFKDKYRCFAGIYFLYRILFLSAHVFIPSLLWFYAVSEVMLIIMLAVHSITQPYQTKWHNTLDTLMFTNLAIINGLSICIFYNFSSSSVHVQLQEFQWIQVTFIYLPILYITAYIAHKIYTSNHCKELPRIKKVFHSSTHRYYDDDELPARLLSNVFEDYKSFESIN